MKQVLKEVCRVGHIRSSIIQTNLIALLLLLGVFVLFKVRFPLVVVLILSAVVVVVLVAVYSVAHDRLMRGVLERVDEIGIYGIGYEREFARVMVSELMWVLIFIASAGVFIFSANATGTVGEILGVCQVLWWPVLLINVLQFIFWCVRRRLLAKTYRPKIGN